MTQLVLLRLQALLALLRLKLLVASRRLKMLVKPGTLEPLLKVKKTLNLCWLGTGRRKLSS
jgi:hypothetical protein